MKTARKILTFFLCMLLICVPLLQISASPAKMPEKTATILFTHDMHSHFLPVKTENGGESGGYARLYTLLERERAAAPGAITLDGGDFSMGSLFQTIYATDAAELRILGNLGYDAVTLGNHEFDFRQSGLTEMLTNALRSGDKLPPIVLSNYFPHKEGDDSFTESDSAAWKAYEDYGIRDYIMIEKEGVRFAVFGIFGEESHEDAPMSGMVFEDPVTTAKRVVAAIQANETYDFIVCLSHSGTSEKLSDSEDVKLAKSVDGIDVIVSGHSHTTLTEPISVNDTLIVSCGSYAQNLGVLKIARGTNGKVKLLSYELIPVDETVEENAEIASVIADYKELVSEHYLTNYGMTFDEVLAVSSFDFDEVYGAQADKAIGNLIADAYWYAVKEAEGDDAEPLAFTMNAAGVIRGTFPAGNITVSDAFNVLSLGVGADGTPGYPLVSFYLTGREIKDGFEVDASVTPLMPAAQLYGRGMYWKYNTSRMIFNKVVEGGQTLEDGTVVPLEDDKLYRIVTGLYCCQMLSTVNAKSFGILSITPRNADGSFVTDYDSLILHDKDGNEIKEWYALASYLKTFEKNEDGVPVIPDSYSSPEARKVVYASMNPYELLRGANIFTWAVILIVLLIIAVIVLVSVKIVKRKKKSQTDKV